jgi:hypothetical protein
LAALAWAFLFELDLPVAIKLNPWMKNQRNVIKRRSTHLIVLTSHTQLTVVSTLISWWHSKN